MVANLLKGNKNLEHFARLGNVKYQGLFGVKIILKNYEGNENSLGKLI